jgi:signal transduction histidine kinase
VALYASHLDEVSFPLAMEGGERVEWRSRRAGSGLTEYVLRTRRPLLIRGDVDSTLEQLRVESIGQLARCWLGVPILAGDEVLGVIAVQSYRSSTAYDATHERVLATIGAQAAVAIQNARLYGRTDEALARRVQELDSILRTVGEGVVLLDTECRTVAVNRALGDLLSVAQLEVEGQAVDAPVGEGSRPFVGLLGYEREDLIAECETLAAGADNDEPIKQVVVTLEPSGRHVERTLTPVRTGETISGWLLVLRDVTEEIELERLKDDLTHMLVHDLRSPLTILSSGLTLMDEAFAERDPALFSTVIEMAQQSSDRMLNLVNELLDVSAFESGELTPEYEVTDPRKLLDEVAAALLPLARSADIALEVSVPEHVPYLWVDVALIGRVLSNLVDNAIKFAPDGSCVTLWARPDSEDGSKGLLLGVSDEGPGIPREEQEALFEKFHRVASVKGRRAGTGLGLPFCKLAVEAHGGRIWVESPSRDVGSENAGSTFMMTLPTEDCDRRTAPRRP